MRFWKNRKAGFSAAQAIMLIGVIFAGVIAVVVVNNATNGGGTPPVQCNAGYTLINGVCVQNATGGGNTGTTEEGDLCSNVAVWIKNKESNAYVTGTVYAFDKQYTDWQGAVDALLYKDTATISTGSTGVVMMTFSEFVQKFGTDGTAYLYTWPTGYEPVVLPVKLWRETQSQSWNCNVELETSTSGTVWVEDQTITLTETNSSNVYAWQYSFNVGSTLPQGDSCKYYVLKGHDTNSTANIDRMALDIPQQGVIYGAKLDPNNTDMFFWTLQKMPTGKYTFYAWDDAGGDGTSTITLYWYNRPTNGCTVVPTQVGAEITTARITFS